MRIVVGGAVAGLIASRWPDIVEPAFCPSHRQFAHSVTAASGVLTGAVQLTPQWEAHWRSLALNLRRQQRRADVPPADRLLLSLLEMLTWVLVGAITGAAAGIYHTWHLTVIAGTVARFWSDAVRKAKETGARWPSQLCLNLAELRRSTFFLNCCIAESMRSATNSS